MIVVSNCSMVCMDCGGFHFLAENGIVTHPDGEMYKQYVGRLALNCPNIGKKFAFPGPPTEATEVK